MTLLLLYFPSQKSQPTSTDEVPKSVLTSSTLSPAAVWRAVKIGSQLSPRFNIKITFFPFVYQFHNMKANDRLGWQL